MQLKADITSLLLLFFVAFLSAAEGGRLQIRNLQAPNVSLRISDERSERCLHLKPNEAMVVRAVGQHFGDGTFLLAHAEDKPEPEDGDYALNALLEALLDGCEERNNTGGRPWLIDIGIHESAVAALASSLGCAVAAFDPQDSGVKALETTRCINAPQGAFEIFPALAVATGTSTSSPVRMDNRSKWVAPRISLDSVFSDDAGASNRSKGEIALLKIAFRRCCGKGAALHALQGARGLLQGGRVRCLATEMIFDRNASALVDFLRDVEGMGYVLLQAGPLTSPNKVLGSHPLFRTDAKQLHELYDTFVKIRRFDERTGFRVYGDGLSLDRDGRYFDYTNLVVACRGQLPSKLVVKNKARLRFRGGKWWLEDEGSA